MDTEQNSDYFISMTDMMVGVLFVFIIIVSYFVLELQKSIEAKDVIPKPLHQTIVQAKEHEITRLQEELERLRRNSWGALCCCSN